MGELHLDIYVERMRREYKVGGRARAQTDRVYIESLYF
jgi:translation elongation factor EF-G